MKPRQFIGGVEIPDTGHKVNKKARRPVEVSVKFNPHDLWVGVYWGYSRTSYDSIPAWVSGGFYSALAMYICLIPCLPIHIKIRRYYPDEVSEY